MVEDAAGQQSTRIIVGGDSHQVITYRGQDFGYRTQPKYTCFVAMPITTPQHLVPQYRNDPDHFTHLLDCLFCPALVAAGFEVIEPSMRQGEFIHAEVIKNLAQCDLVLCDMSTLNSNVFMELGIRIALNRPVALIRDEFTKQIPFDVGVIGYHTYNSNLAEWMLRGEIPKLTKFVKAVFEKSDNKNPLWQQLGIAPKEDNPQDSLVITEEAIEEERDKRVIVLQRIVDTCNKRNVKLVEVKWWDSLGGEYLIKVEPNTLDIRTSLTGDFEIIEERFDAILRLVP